MEKPTMSQRFASFGKFLYNSEEKTVLGRGGRSWAEIGLFYVIYYICLASFFAATLAVFYQTIDDHKPKLMGSASLLKANPGMGFQPMPDIDTTLVYSTMETDQNEEYVKSINKVLKAYKAAHESNDGVDCSSLTDMREDENKPCGVNFTALTEECHEGNAYGMAEGNPCVLLKLNKIYGWKPDIWTAAEVVDTKITQQIKNDYMEDRIWIDCHGENPADEDNIEKAVVKYYPQQGFPLPYYPYQKQKGYLSPLVFVKFSGLAKHFAYMIECKALAKNIAVDREEKEGSVHFELLID